MHPHATWGRVTWDLHTSSDKVSGADSYEFVYTIVTCVSRVVLLFTLLNLVTISANIGDLVHESSYLKRQLGPRKLTSTKMDDLGL